MIISLIGLAGLAALSLFAAAVIDLRRAKLAPQETGVWADTLLRKLREPGAQGMIVNANLMYVRLFDLIYGENALTKKRVKASVISSLGFLVIFTLLIGIEHTPWPKLLEGFGNGISKLQTTSGIENVKILMGLLVLPSIPVFANLIPDFYSLIETRMVLRWSRKANGLGIVALFVLDLILTMIVFLSSIFLAGILIGIVVNLLDGRDVFAHLHLNYDFRSRDIEKFIEIMFAPKVGLVFVLTTFVTSFFWFLFVLSFGLLKTLHSVPALSRTLHRFLAGSRFPILRLTLCANTALAIVFFLAFAIVA